MRMIILSAVMIVIAACAAPASDANSNKDDTSTKLAKVSIEAKENLSASDRAACEAAGGEVGRAGMIGWEHCIMPYADADKVCSDNSECEGQCRYTLPPQGNQPVTGKCQVNTLPFGCYSEVVNGKATPMLCVD